MGSEEYKEINEFFAKRKAVTQKNRMDYAISQLNRMNIMPQQLDNNQLQFKYRGETIRFYPHSGWFTGKSVKDGRGIKKLLKELGTK